MKSAHRSVTPDSERLLLLRQQLGWTQREVAAKSGYSVRLIRKIEKQQSVRPQTLKDIVECYSRAINAASPKIENFILRPSRSEVENSSSEDTGVECELVTKMLEYYDVVYHKRQPNRITDYCCPNIRYTSEGKSRVGVEAIQQRAETLLNAFDPIEFLVDRIFSNNQTVVTSWTACMKHTRDFLDIPATGSWVKVRGNSIVAFANGLAVESEDQLDLNSLVRQLTGKERRVTER